MFTFLITLGAGLISLHVGSYGWYVWREENNLRGAAGVFIIAGLTFLAPVALLWYYAFFAN